MNRLLRLSPRERNLTLCTAAVLATAALYVYAIEPLYGEWSAAREMAQTLDDERTTLLSLIDHREAIESGYAAMEGAIAIGTSVEELQLNFVRDVETIARREGLRVANIRPLGHSAEAPFHRLAVQVTTEGEHHQFVRFLQAMQRPDTLLRGDTITVVASRRTPPLSITLRISKLVRVHG